MLVQAAAGEGEDDGPGEDQGLEDTQQHEAGGDKGNDGGGGHDGLSVGAGEDAGREDDDETGAPTMMEAEEVTIEAMAELHERCAYTDATTHTCHQCIWRTICCTNYVAPLYRGPVQNAQYFQHWQD